MTMQKIRAELLIIIDFQVGVEHGKGNNRLSNKKLNIMK